MTLTQTTSGRIWGALLALLLVASLALSANVAFAQTDSTGSGTMQTTQAADDMGDNTPGVPNTGAGVDPTTVMLVIVAAVVVAGGLGYLLTTPRETSS